MILASTENISQTKNQVLEGPRKGTVTVENKAIAKLRLVRTRSMDKVQHGGASTT